MPIERPTPRAARTAAAKARVSILPPMSEAMTLTAPKAAPRAASLNAMESCFLASSMSAAAAAATASRGEA